MLMYTHTQVSNFRGKTLFLERPLFVFPLLELFKLVYRGLAKSVVLGSFNGFFSDSVCH